MTVTADSPVFDKDRIIHPCIHVLEDKYGLMTAVASGGNSLNWFRNTFCPDTSLEEMNAEAEKTSPGSKGLTFVPLHMSWHGKGSFINIDTSHEFRHFVRSVFEGVVLSNRIHLDTFAKNKISIKRVIMIGGGAKSSVWPHIVADVSNIPLILNEQKEAACAGAALLAGYGTGVFTSIEEMSKRFNREHSIIRPDGKNVETYNRLYEDFVRYSTLL
jgi:xylulokinase